MERTTDGFLLELAEVIERYDYRKGRGPLAHVAESFSDVLRSWEERWDYLTNEMVNEEMGAEIGHECRFQPMPARFARACFACGRIEE